MKQLLISLGIFVYITFVPYALFPVKHACLRYALDRAFFQKANRQFYFSKMYGLLIATTQDGH